MAYAEIKNAATHEQTEKRGFLKRLWQRILQCDDALNFDPRDDLARRISELERRSKV
jgi:hypothetical protein